MTASAVRAPRWMPSPPTAVRPTATQAPTIHLRKLLVVMELSFLSPVALRLARPRPGRLFRLRQERDLSRTRGRPELERAGRDLRAHIPVSEQDRKLRAPLYLLARDHVLARNRIASLGDPDLPVGLVTAIREVMAGAAVDRRRPHVAARDRVLHQHGIRIAVDKVRR